jgi:glycerol-3-phosphate acyltransferase PlsY
LGSLPFAYWLSKAVGGIDIHTAGSGNPGAVNVYRKLGSVAALVVLLLDDGKGAAAVLLPRWLGAPDIALFAAALTAVVGHNWSVFLGLRGGKGTAFVMGISLAVLPLLTAIVVPFTVAALVITRNVGISITFSFILLNVLTIATSQPMPDIALCLVLTTLVAGTHIIPHRHRVDACHTGKTVI